METVQEVGAMIGEIVGSYRLVRTIGAGGMGEVYLAEHVLLGKRAAVKVLLPERCVSREIVDRFFNEAKASSLIRHPGIVEVYDFGHLPNGNAYLVMEYLEGESLGDRLRRVCPLSASQATAIARHIAGALSAAHAHGIVHRDLKPDNVFLVPDAAMPRGERAKVLDFGIAKLAGGVTADLVKTQTGRVLGTPYYMSPEQCRGAGKIDRRSDIYSLGCVLYQMLTGTPPFVMEGAGEILAAHIHVEPRSVRELEPKVPRELDRVVMRLLAKDAERRYGSMEEVTAALNEAVPRFAGDDAPEPSLADSSAQMRSSRLMRRADPSDVHDAPTVTTVDVPAPGRRRRWLRIGVVAASVTSVGVGVLLARDDKGGRPRPVDVSVTEPVEKPQVAPLAVSPAELTAGTPAASQPADDSRPIIAPGAADAVASELVLLRIDTVPSNANVYREADGVRIGRTPLEYMVRRGEGEAAFIVRRAGYRRERLQLPVHADQDRVLVLRPKSAGERDEPEPVPVRPADAASSTANGERGPAPPSTSGSAKTDAGRVAPDADAQGGSSDSRSSDAGGRNSGVGESAKEIDKDGASRGKESGKDVAKRPKPASPSEQGRGDEADGGEKPAAPKGELKPEAKPGGDTGAHPGKDDAINPFDKAPK